MKAQIYRPVKRQMILIMMILGFIAGSYAQKSAATLKADNNLKHFMMMVEVLNRMENDRIALYLQPVGFENTEPGSIELKLDRINFVSEFSNSDAMMLSEEEEDLEVEDWMLDEDYFMHTVSNDEMYQTQEEEKIVVEDWMLDESHFLPNKANLNSVEDIAEDKLQIENWMLDPNHWVLGAD